MNEVQLGLYHALRKTEVGVPKGSYFASHLGMNEAERITAIKRTRVLGAQLAAEHPEVADLYRDVERGLTYFDIAEEFLPRLVKENRMFASRVIGVAVRSLIPADEQERITAERRAIYLKKRLEGIPEEAYHKHQSRAAKIRNAMHPNIEAMIRGRGQIPWGPEEKAIVLELMIHDPEYQHTRGSMKGHPNYVLVAEDINLLYHDGHPVRSPKNVSDMTKEERKKAKKRQQAQ